MIVIRRASEAHTVTLDALIERIIDIKMSARERHRLELSIITLLHTRGVHFYSYLHTYCTPINNPFGGVQ